MLEPVLRSPAFSLSNQPWRVAATGAKTSCADRSGATRAGDDFDAAGTAAGSEEGVGDFFRKKLNMRALFKTGSFYEIG
jgi:hypothetical protein